MQKLIATFVTAAFLSICRAMFTDPKRETHGTNSCNRLDVKRLYARDLPGKGDL